MNSFTSSTPTGSRLVIKEDKAGGSRVTAQFNPNTLRWNGAISLNSDGPMDGYAQPRPKYIETSSVSFDLRFDDDYNPYGLDTTSCASALGQLQKWNDYKSGFSLTIGLEVPRLKVIMGDNTFTGFLTKLKIEAERYKDGTLIKAVANVELVLLRGDGKSGTEANQELFG
jgi:hypothetical protein